MNRTRSALSRLAWGYLLLFFHINIGPLSLLPQWAAWLILAWGIYGLVGMDRDLALLWPFGAVLALLDLSQPLLAGVWAGWLTLLQTVLYLYVHFGLLTSCARLAGRFQAPGSALDVRFRRLRNAFIILDTLTGFVLNGRCAACHCRDHRCLALSAAPLLSRCPVRRDFFVGIPVFT